jgi:hypothetical protein
MCTEGDSWRRHKVAGHGAVFLQLLSFAFAVRLALALLLVAVS